MLPYASFSSIKIPELKCLKNFFPTFFIKKEGYAHFISKEAATKNLDHFQFTTVDLAEIAAKTEEDLKENWNFLLNEIMEILAVLSAANKMELSTKQNLEDILGKLSFDNIQAFFDILAVTTAEKDLPSLPEFTLQAFSSTLLIDRFKEKYPDLFDSLEKWIQKAAKCLPEELPSFHNREERIKKSRHSNVVTRFFPNLMHIFLKAFDLFDAARPPDTLYEYGVLAALYFHFFKLPYVLIGGLAAFMATPLEVLLTAVCLMGMAVGMLYLYLRWLKKCPDEVSYCENLTKKFQNGEIDPVLCREPEYAEGLGCFGNGKHDTRVNLVLVGEPGTGKTEWIRGLPEHMPGKKVFVFQNWQLFGASSSVKSAAEKMSDAFKEVRFYEQEVLFVCDELGDAFESRPKDLSAFLKPILGNKGIQFIAVMTLAQWEALKEADLAFQERFKPIVFQSTHDTQTKKILLDRVRRHAQDISVTDSFLNKLIEETNKQQGHCQPRKAIKLLNELINKVHEFNPDHYTSSELISAKEDLRNLREQTELADTPLSDPFSERYRVYLEDVKKATKAVKRLEKEVDQKKGLLKKIIQYQRHHRLFLKTMKSAARQLTDPLLLEENKKEDLQKTFLFTHFFACRRLQKAVEEMTHGLHSKDLFTSLHDSLIYTS